MTGNGNGIILTRYHLELWAGRELSDTEVTRIAAALPWSSVPEAVNVIAESMRED